MLLAGPAWLANQLDAPVPWRFLPSAGLVLVGLAVTAAADSPGGLLGLGVT